MKENRLIEIYQLYDDLLKSIAPIGEQLADLLEDNSHENFAFVGYDILKRIRGNIATLQFLPVNENSILAIRLIMRSVIGDLIIGLYLFTRNSKSFQETIDSLDYESLKSINNFLETHARLYNNKRIRNIIKNKYKSFLKTERKKISIIEMDKGLKNVDCPRIKELELYAEYRVLSQSEHYSPKNRPFSYYFKDSEIFILKHARIIHYTTSLFIELIQFWIENHEFNAISFTSKLNRSKENDTTE